MFPTYGPNNAEAMLIGDAPYGSDTAMRRPYASPSTQIVPLTLNRYGCIFNGCLSTYVLDEPLHSERGEDDYITTKKKAAEERGWFMHNGYYARPSIIARRAEMLRLIDSCAPSCVLLTGEIALWLVTGEKSISTMRGSILPSLPLPSGRIVKCVCTYSPRDVNVNPALRDICERDIQRFVDELSSPHILEPEWDFMIQAQFDDYIAAYDELYARLESGEVIKMTLDIETIRMQIACVGIGLSRTKAIILPIRTSIEYWSIQQEVELIKSLERVVTHPNARITCQNGLYDLSMLGIRWGIVPRLVDDTMDMQHVRFPGVKKSLDFLASIYCNYYRYWKDELDDYKNAPRNDRLFFAYNGRDCCYTFEIRDKLEEHLRNEGLYQLYRGRMERSFWTILRTNLRGIRVNHTYRAKLAMELLDASQQRTNFINTVIGRDFNPRSSTQMKQFFYEEMRVKPERSRTTKRDSLGAEILVKMHENYPLLGPIADAIIEQRSIGVFMSTFVQAPVDFDGRMRTAFALTGPETFRLASRENPWGTGSPMFVISARFAPFPPSRSFMSLLPSWKS